MPTQELSGTTALVTGASRGFGRAIAIAKHGAWFKDPAGNTVEVLQER
jgi:NAD(P)-dependent dehydrogenase (short-subunit alcohol dehydrogenase family)